MSFAEIVGKCDVPQSLAQNLTGGGGVPTRNKQKQNTHNPCFSIALKQNVKM